MAGLVNQETNKSVSSFIDAIENNTRKEDCQTLLTLMENVSGFEPKVWGDNYFIGFGKYKYRRKGGKEEFEWFHVGFAPRKSNLTVYITFDIGQEEELLKQLGKCKWGKGCLYINKLADINLDILKQLIEKSKNATWHQN